MRDIGCTAINARAVAAGRTYERSDARVEGSLRIFSGGQEKPMVPSGDARTSGVGLGILSGVNNPDFDTQFEDLLNRSLQDESVVRGQHVPLH